MITFPKKAIRYQIAGMVLLAITVLSVTVGNQRGVGAEGIGEQHINADDDLDFAYKLPLAAYNNHDYDRAIQLWTKLIQRRANYVEAYFNRALAYRAKNQFDRAIEDYTTIARLKPNLADTYLCRGFCYAHRMQYDEAIADYSRFLVVAASSASPTPDITAKIVAVKRDIRLAYYAKRDYASATAQENALSASSDSRKDEEEYLHEAVACVSSGDMDRGDFDRAIRDYEAAAVLAPTDPRPQYHQALALEKKADHLTGDAAAQADARQQAEAAFRAYLQVAPPTDPMVKTVKAHLLP